VSEDGKEPMREQDAPSAGTTPADAERLDAARRAMLEGVGQEIASSFPGITRLGGQIVAALYIGDGPQSMDTMSETLGRSKSNVFTNLKALEGAGIVERRRATGARHDSYALTGPYPDVIIGAYIGRLRRVVADKRALTQRTLSLLGDARGAEAEALRKRLRDLQRKYELFARMFSLFGTTIDGPVDLEALLTSIPPNTMQMLAEMVKTALGASDSLEAKGSSSGSDR